MSVLLVHFALSDEQAEALAMLGRFGGTGDKRPRHELAMIAISHLISSATDGVRRPGAWERGWVEQAFGEVDTEPHDDGVPFHEQPKGRAS